MNEKTKQPAGREAVNAALKQLMSEGVEVNTGEGTEGEEKISLAEKVREAYEGSIEYRLGCQIMDGLTQGYALTSDDAEAMLTGEYAPKSSENAKAHVKGRPACKGHRKLPFGRRISANAAPNARGACNKDKGGGMGRGGREERPQRRRARRDRKAEGPPSAAHAHENHYTRERGAGLFNHEQ